MAVPALNGIHELGDSGLRLGDVTGSIWPRYRLTSIPGFKSLPVLEDSRDTPAGRTGEIPRRALRRGKPFTYQGIVEARGQYELDVGIDALVAACAPTEEMRVAVTPKFQPTYIDPTSPTAPPTALNYFYYARVTALDPTVEYAPASALNSPTRGFQQAFSLGMRMSDARFLVDQVSVTETAGISSISGTPLPWVLPVAISPPESSAGSASVAYLGTAPADPILDLYGPATNPGMANDTVGTEIRFRLSLGTDQFLRLDFRDRTAMLGGTEDVHHLLDRERSTWWTGDTHGITPGITNSLRYLGDLLQDPAHAVISYYDAYWS